MAENLDILSAAVSLLIRAALLAARCSGRVGKRSLKRLVAMDTDAKAKGILFFKDRVYQLEMQVSVFQKQAHIVWRFQRLFSHVRVEVSEASLMVEKTYGT